MDLSSDSLAELWTPDTAREFIKTLDPDDIIDLYSSFD